MDFQETLKLIPHQSGVYRFLDKQGTVIYVGKAKDLHKRVSQYFSASRNHSLKTLRLVRSIDNIIYTVVANESEALLLENNLIKRLKPKYNILLKDDKTYPWIVIKNEPFPRVFLTRRIIKDGSKYFGPYTSGHVARQLVELVHNLYPLRTCTLQLSKEKIAEGKFKTCLKSHIFKCLSPCTGGQSEEDYRQNIECINQIFKGNSGEIYRQIESKMKEAANRLDFEQAQEQKLKLELLGQYRAKSVIVSTDIPDVDIFTLVESSDAAYANFMRVSHGAIIQSQNLTLTLRIDETPEDLLAMFITEIQCRHTTLSREILVPFMPSLTMEKYNIHVPQKGDKKALVELSMKNARAWQNEQLLRKSASDPDSFVKEKLLQLQKDLSIPLLPIHIECFDNSNILGTYPVGACVVFRNGKPSKRDYRHFNIKTVEGPDDYATMEEVVTRRYSRLINEAGGPEEALKPTSPLPQLIVIDGGKGQLSKAYGILTKLGLTQRIAMVGLAERLEEIYLPNDPVPLYLDKNSFSLKVLMQIRDEAHRFGITHHRNRRSKGFTRIQLQDIKGIGEVTAQKLLARFKSMKQIEAATFEQWVDYGGLKAANALRDYFDKKKNENNRQNE